MTGGRVSIGQLAPNAMSAIDAGTRFQYLLACAPTNGALDSRFRQIRIAVRRPGVTVSYRHGYYASPPSTPLDRRQTRTYSRVVAAANYPDALPDIGVRGSATGSVPPDPASVKLDLTIDPARLSVAQTNGRNAGELELLVACLDGGGNLLTQVWKRIELDYSDERLAAVRASGVRVSLALPVGRPVSAVRNIKVIVYDYGADLVGSAVIKIEQTSKE